MRIAFLRSVDIHQALPAFGHAITELRATGHTVATFLVDDRPPPTAIGETHHLPALAEVDTIADTLLRWRPDRVISISVPDDKAVRDSLVFAALRRERPTVTTVLHPVELTYTFSNKWETRRLAEAAGIPTPRGIFVSGDLLHQRGVVYSAHTNLLARRLESLTYPVVAKPIWDSMATGIQRLDTPATALDWLTHEAPDIDFLVEEFLDGELFGIEILATEHDQHCQPLIRKCTDGSRDLVPFNHIRFGPVTDTHYESDRLRHRLLSLARELGLHGNAEFEFIYAHNRFHLIEVNPRVSGLTNLSTAISGVNTYTALATSDFAVTHPPRFVAEIPLTDLDPATATRLRTAPDILSLHNVVYHDGTTQAKLLLTAPDTDTALARAARLTHDHNVIAPHVLAEFAAALGAYAEPHP
ncbi:ATP-grasp domain-containing protein [Nocardia sp. NPDC003482]